MKGKKTYTAIAIGIAYIVGGKLNLWPLDTALIHAAGLAAIGFLRSAIRDAATPTVTETPPTTTQPKL